MQAEPRGQGAMPVRVRLTAMLGGAMNEAKAGTYSGQPQGESQQARTKSTPARRRSALRVDVMRQRSMSKPRTPAGGPAASRADAWPGCLRARTKNGQAASG